jgi:truncated hemoglobin YjbI
MEAHSLTLAMPARVQPVDLYAAVGGTAGCRALSVAFYANVAQDPLLRPLFPGTTFTCAIEEFAAFLVQFLGGPPEAAQRRHWPSLRESHRRFRIGPREREAWLRRMRKALDTVPLEEPVRRAVHAFFSQSSAYLVNQEQAPPSAVCRGELLHDDIGRELVWRWEVQRGLDDAVAAVRDGDAAHAVALARSSLRQTCLQRDRPVWATLLALMIDSGHGVMLDYIRATLGANPDLVQEHYSGRTLLHDASAAGSVQIVAVLPRLGADPNSMDAEGHAPLCWVSNACKEGAGEQVVRTLAAAGATVNAAGGVTRATALHMAARRGNVAIAAALLDCGAAIEARDRRGDTPLRRAVNCEQTAAAAFLLAQGADRHAQGSQGLTPFLAARTGAMKRLLQCRMQ